MTRFPYQRVIVRNAMARVLQPRGFGIEAQEHASGQLHHRLAHHHVLRGDVDVTEVLLQTGRSKTEVPPTAVYIRSMTRSSVP